jgi:hypothetical protein
MMLSVMPSLRYSVSGSPETLTNGRTASESENLGGGEGEPEAAPIAAIRDDSVSRFSR